MSERVIAMDPGGRSGFAWADMSPDRFEFGGAGVLRQDLMEGWWWSQHKDFDTFVYESWYPRPDENGSMEWIRGNELDEAQHIGALKFIARRGALKIVTQHPGDKPMAVKTMPEKLAALDGYSNEQHDMDARQHLWLYFWRNWFGGSMSPERVVFT